MKLNYKGIDIHYTKEGVGKTVVLLHGFLENLGMWNEVKKSFLKSNRVVTIDLLGHGKTSCLGYIHTMEEMADAIEAVLKELRIRKPILVGHSMGGYVALAYAEKYPEKVKGFCLMNSTTLEDDVERKKLRARANKMVQTNFDAMVRMSFVNLFGEQSKSIYKKEIAIALAEALLTPLQGYIACQEGMRIRPNRTHVLQKANYPKLFIIGKNDPVVDYEASLKEVKETNSEIVVFPNGHMSHIENTEELSKCLLKFLRSI